MDTADWLKEWATKWKQLLEDFDPDSSGAERVAVEAAFGEAHRIGRTALPILADALRALDKSNKTGTCDACMRAIERSADPSVGPLYCACTRNRRCEHRQRPSLKACPICAVLAQAGALRAAHERGEGT